MADIVRLPVERVPVRCGDCEHALHGSGGVFCRQYLEDIWDEKIAEECDDFDPVPWARSGAKEKTS